MFLGPIFGSRRGKDKDREKRKKNKGEGDRGVYMCIKKVVGSNGRESMHEE